MSDQINITILADGTIKSTTNKVSDVNHQSAEAFLRGVQDLAGGPTESKHKHGHSHEHEHHHHEEDIA